MSKRQVIGVISLKGGVGKSTLCQLIASVAAAQGKQAKILDFDIKQTSSVEWVRQRLERDLAPPVEAEPSTDVRKALKHNRDYDVIVVDGMPGRPKRTTELAAECDLVVLPTGASRTDLVPTLALARRIATMRKARRLVLAICRVGTIAEANRARAAIHAAGFEAVEGELIERPGYRQAQDYGRSASETSFPRLNSSARTLAQTILELPGSRAWAAE
jgi:chromosome partitioning protein